MCTAATYQTSDFYMGRTLDYEFSYGDQVTIIPRNYPLPFRYHETRKEHYAIIGMAYVLNDYPLYYDAVNEKGVGIAGLNFVGNARYEEELSEEKANVAQYELIPWLLCQCASVQEVKELLEQIEEVKEETNPDLKTVKCFITKYQKRNEAHHQGAEIVKRWYPTMETMIRFSVVVAKSTFVRTPVTLYSPRSAAAEDYEKLVTEYLNMIGGNENGEI